MFSVFLETLRAGTIFTPLSSLLLNAMNLAMVVMLIMVMVVMTVVVVMNLAMVVSSLSSKSSLLKVVLLIAEPGHLSEGRRG